MNEEKKIIDHLLHQLSSIKSRFNVVYNNRELWDNFAKPIRQKIQECLGVNDLPSTVVSATLKEQEHENYVEINVDLEVEPGLHRVMEIVRPTQSNGKMPAVLLLQSLREVTECTQDLAGKLLKLGCLVATIPLRKIGEPGSGDFNRQIAAATLLGRPYLGQLVIDDFMALQHLMCRENVDRSRICIVGIADAAFRAAILSCLNKKTAATVCAGGISSFRVLLNKLDPTSWTPQATTLIPPGFIRYMDQGQVLACNVPRPLLVISSKRDPLVPVAGAMESVGYTKRTYAEFKVTECLIHSIVDTDVPIDAGMVETIVDFVQNHSQAKAELVSTDDSA